MDYSSISAEELAVTCFRTGDEYAWAEFVRRFQPLIASVAIRVARKWGDASPQIVDELVQDTYLKLCSERAQLLEKFKPMHKDAAYGYIKVFTANLVHDRFRSSRAQKRGGGINVSSMDREFAVQAPTATETSMVSLERKMLLEKVAHCLEKVSSGPNSERDRRIFWLYYRVGLTANAIAALPALGLSTKGVETTILRLTRAIRRELAGRGQGDPTGQHHLEGMSPENSF